MTEHALQINKIYQRSALWVGAYCATSLLLLLIAPILSFIFTGLVLINSKAIVTRMPRLYLAMVMILSLAMMAGARPLEAGDSNDIVGKSARYIAENRGAEYFIDINATLPYMEKAAVKFDHEYLVRVLNKYYKSVLS